LYSSRFQSALVLHGLSVAIGSPTGAVGQRAELLEPTGRAVAPLRFRM